MTRIATPVRGRFEHVKVNDFEQLCKNYAVEKIRGQFLWDELASNLDKDVSGTAKSGNREDPAWVHDAMSQVESSSRLLRMFEGKCGIVARWGKRNGDASAPDRVSRYSTTEGEV